MVGRFPGGPSLDVHRPEQLHPNRVGSTKRIATPKPTESYVLVVQPYRSHASRSSGSGSVPVTSRIILRALQTQLGSAR